MAVLPGSLALTAIGDGALAVAADVRNNFTAIQIENNALLTILGAGTAGDVFSGVGTTVQFAKPPGYEYAYNEFAANATITATTEATANTVVTASAVTFDGATPVMIEFFSVGWEHNTASTRLSLWLYDGAASIGQIDIATSTVAAATSMPSLTAKRRLTPSAAAHTYSVRASTVAGTGTIYAGVGGLGATAPGFIRITKV